MASQLQSCRSLESKQPQPNSHETPSWVCVLTLSQSAILGKDDRRRGCRSNANSPTGTNYRKPFRSYQVLPFRESSTSGFHDCSDNGVRSGRRSCGQIVSSEPTGREDALRHPAKSTCSILLSKQEDQNTTLFARCNSRDGQGVNGHKRFDTVCIVVSMPLLGQRGSEHIANHLQI